MRIAYVINSKQYNYHKSVLSDFTAVIPGEVYDLAEWNYRIVSEIVQNDFDVIIFFDLVGHVYRTTSDTLSFNELTSRVAHILFRRTEEYVNIGYRQNISSFMYISKRDDIGRVKNKCDEVPNIEYFEDFKYKAESGDEHDMNRDSIKKWWGRFLEDARINETADI